ncbi:kyphoscoliosis peptidase-like [Cyprinus carpio]|uniref:Kyphoscoliosis peptidase-like n=1 Tax=Cyprinus carpio TaxID=7962 RepID=A0A9Q9X3K0_CYPCA|nr:kyphoscoliosis peptidase-like [Cyprinus carpio]
MCFKMCLKMKCFNCFYTKRSDRHSNKMTNSPSKASGEPPVHTPTSQPNLRHDQQSKQDRKETAKTTGSKRGQAEGIPKEDAVVLKEWSFKTSESSITGGKTGQMTARPQPVNAKEPIKSFVSEKGDMMDTDEERSLDKRRESKENSTNRLKRKNTITKEKDSRKSSTTSSKKLTLNRPRRKLKKDLIPNPEVFHKIDTYAINAGRELRIKKIFSVQAITQTITEGASSDLDKLRAIWIWLCHYIEYDVKGYLGLSKMVYSPEQVILTGRAVCSGYSSVCLQMCREAGIECREVSGHGKGAGYRPGQSYRNIESNHSWNAVCLDGQWYLLDACWGAGNVDLDNRAFIKRYKEYYFLTDPENFIDSHFPEKEEWQLLESPIKIEEFEKRVLKKPDFYTLNLTLNHPKHFLIVTENGEATVSMSFPQLVHFTYQISQLSGKKTQELSKSIGFLTSTQQSMKLRLMPPKPGMYELELFARAGNTPKTYNWICSFQLECPSPKISEELPENPHECWGLQPDATSLGLEPCNYGNEIISLESGSFRLVLKTTRPLMVLCELSHKNLDKTLAKKCLAIQPEPDQLTCSVLCPYYGYYRLSVFVRDWANEADSFENAGNFLLHCTAGAVSLNELFPSGLSSNCGPGIKTLEAGLFEFSHTEALVYTQQGKCDITFQNRQDIDLFCKLSKEEGDQPASQTTLSNHVLFTHDGSKVTISINLPESGVYKLGLYGKTSLKPEYPLLCDYILKNTSINKWPPFPRMYGAWKKGSVLFEPRAGQLEASSWVKFCVQVPGARRVSVCGDESVDLQLSENGVWEGKAFTGRGPELHLAASLSEASNNTMSFLMAFSVVEPEHKK